MDLSKAIEEITTAYGRQATMAIDEAVARTAEKTMEKLKHTSPKRTNKYAKSWRAKVSKNILGGKMVVIHNTRYQLTHLLEYGHATRSGGRTRAIAHIKPAEEEATQLFEEELRRNL